MCLKRYLFALANLANMMAMTALLIVFGISGNSQMAADIGVAQSAAAAIFLAFSANARSLVLAAGGPRAARSLFNIRALLMLPLGLLAYWFSSTIGGVAPSMVVILTLRKAAEWLAEVAVSEREQVSDFGFAFRYIMVQGAALVLATSWYFLALPQPELGMLAWAFSPLAMSGRFATRAVRSLDDAWQGISKAMAPHYGSSLVIGVSVYLFRTLLVMTVGKAVAGNLITAYAIGGVLGSVFAMALAPSIAYMEKTHGEYVFPRPVTWAFWTVALIGTVVFAAASTQGIFRADTGRPDYYWQAIGLSMVGSVVMAHAQLLRSRLLIHNEHHDLFGPDVLMNILVIAAIPVGYYTVGLPALTGLALLGALLAWFFYRSSGAAEVAVDDRRARKFGWTMGLVLAAILVPASLSSGGWLVPLVGKATHTMPPASLFVVYVAILVVGAYRRAHRALVGMFMTFLLMALAILAFPVEPAALERRLELMVALLLPMGAMVLGEMYVLADADEGLATTKVVLALMLLCILQQLFTWAAGAHDGLHGRMPVLLVAVFLAYLPNGLQAGPWRALYLAGSTLMGGVVGLSSSWLPTWFLMTGLASALLWHIVRGPNMSLARIATVVACTAAGYGAMQWLWPPAGSIAAAYGNTSAGFRLSSLLPLGGMAIYTAWLVGRENRQVLSRPAIARLCFSLVGMCVLTLIEGRDPHADVLLFFLWGSLLAELGRAAVVSEDGFRLSE